MEDADRYSLQDLIDIKNGALESILEGIHNNLTKHVKVDCEVGTSLLRIFLASPYLFYSVYPICFILFISLKFHKN